MIDLCPEIVGLPEEEEAAALLIECRGATPELLKEQIDSVLKAIDDSGTPVISKVEAEAFARSRGF